MRAMFAAIAVLSIYLLFRGHNLPGGGFVAGLTFAVAIILQYMAGGTRWVEDRLDIRPVLLIGIGPMLATATGAAALLFGYPFLTSHTAHWRVPLLGDVHLPSAFIFDLGVFALVVGATTLILIALAHQSVRGHRAGRET
jgi:multicomponent K+:H+ antiporter subunit A